MTAFNWLLCLLVFPVAAQERYFTLVSPNQKISAEPAVGAQIKYRLLHQGQEIMAFSPLSLTLADGTVLGRNSRLQKPVMKAVDSVVKPLYGFASQISERYNELMLPFREAFSVQFRVYD